MSRENDLQHLITEHQRRLQKLKEQQAQWGFQVPPHILIEIEDCEADIEKLKDELAALKIPRTEPRTKNKKWVRSSLAGILNISLEQMVIVKDLPGKVQLKIPVRAADNLIQLFETDRRVLQELGIDGVRLLYQENSAEITDLAPQDTIPEDKRGRKSHPLRVSFDSNLQLEGENKLNLLVENRSSTEFGLVDLSLVKIPPGLRFDKKRWSFPISPHVTKSIPITVQMTHPGIYQVEVRASTRPTTDAGFLRTSLQLEVKPPPPKCVLEIEFKHRNDE